MGVLDIRPIAVSDQADWRRLWTDYLSFYDTVLPEELFATTFSRLLSSDAQEFHGLLAFVDGRPVGLAHYVFHRSCWQVGNVCYLQDLYADPDVRGTGLGRALIEAVCADASAKGAPEVYWMTADNNVTARTLYDRIAVKTPFIVYQKTF